MKKIYVVVGSTRANRIGRHVSEWVLKHWSTPADFGKELVDLADWNLPPWDEPAIPATAEYAQEHTRAWSQKVAAADGFVFVTPQYNWGYPAPLKNALDHLYKEWQGKPAVIVSYGYHGGDKASAQLRQVLTGGLRMRVADAAPQLTLHRDMIDENGQLKDPDAAFASCVESISQAARELVELLDGPPPASSGDKA